MKLRSLLGPIALALTFAIPSHAALIGTMEGNLGQLPFKGYGGPLTVTSASSSDLQQPWYAFCIDGYSGEVYPADKSHQFQVFDTAAEVDTLRGADPARSAKIMGLMNYFVDHYFADFLAGAYAKTRSDGTRIEGYLFNQVLWELTQDYGRQGGPLDTDPNSPTRRDFYYGLGDGDQNTLLTIAIADLKLNFDAISPDYRSEKYEVRFMDVAPDTYDPDVTNYQSLLAVAAKSSEVPEPSTLALLLAAGGIGVARSRKRTGAQPAA